MPSIDQHRHLAAKARRLAETQSSEDVRKALADYASECDDIAQRMETLAASSKVSTDGSA